MEELQSLAHPFALSIIVTVVGGLEALRRCLAALSAQTNPTEDEIIVPYDACCAEVAALGREFAHVRFHPVETPACRAGLRTVSRHRLYARRRAAGLSLARGTIVALTEDYAVPARDWCRQIKTVHALPHSVVGGAVDNGIDRALNWALYYCDFGRHGRPFKPGSARYVSDVNVSYKHEILQATAPVWRDGYQETTLHWHLAALGHQLHVDPGPVVFQHRDTPGLGAALRERAALGRVFAQTRAASAGAGVRALCALGTPLLPFLLLYRCIRHMLRQHRSGRQIVTAVPLIFFLLVAYAAGELSGYVLSDDVQA